MIISKLYNKNHLFFILFIFIGFIYSLYNYFNYQKIINEYLPIEKVVIGQSCRAYTELASGVYIKNWNKVYNVELRLRQLYKISTQKQDLCYIWQTKWFLYLSSWRI